MPSYPTSVFAPASKTTGQTIQAAHVNDLQDEIVAIEGGLLNGTAPLNSSNSTVANLSVTGVSTFGGAITVSTGTLTLNQGQIVFPATQVASNSTTALDDYREGSWTPSDQSGAGLTFTSPAGSHVKNGQMVIAAFEVTYPVTANGSAAIIGSLPFASQSVGSGPWGGFVTYTDQGAALTLRCIPGGTTFELRNYSGTALTNANMSGKALRGVMVYRATA